MTFTRLSVEAFGQVNKEAAHKIMTKFQQVSSKFSVCRTLIIASALWLGFILIFYYSWDTEFNENVEYPSHLVKQVEVFNAPTIDEFDKIRGEEKTLINRNKPRKNVSTDQPFGFKSLVTPVSAKLLKELNLVNPGENGKGVKLSNFSSEIAEKIRMGWKRHEFNEFLSDIISVHRRLPDPRDAYCKQPNLYREKLPATSVIFIFHNEAWSTLLRSVHSVIDQSPDRLISEIILVDDFSNMPHLKKPLDEYMAKFPKVKILRAKSRGGLIKARILGAKVAKGPVLTFLDSHVECAPGWLEPLLDRIAIDSTNVVCPVIDVIDDDTLAFSYQTSEMLQVGGFDWQLVFDWNMVPQVEKDRKKNFAEPTRSPTMAGGLFSIDKVFFEKLGMYDPDFDIWGAENLEISFKTWMCGGTLEIIPCSHVGHIFRKKSPYKWRPGVDVLRRNTIRLAEVWMDEYAKIYYLRTGEDKGDFGDISERVKLRKDLNCKSFKWYMETVYSHMKVPDNLAEGEVHNEGSTEQSCLDGAVREGDTSGRLQLYGCHHGGGNQFFEYTKEREIRKGEHCLDYNNELQLYQCHSAKGTQEWTYDLNTKQIIHNLRKLCLTLSDMYDKLVMQACNQTLPRQKWNFQYLYPEKF